MPGKHTRKYVLPITHKLIVGWPATFNMVGTSEKSFEATQFYINAPSEGFVRLHSFLCTRAEEIEFWHFTLPFVRIARLPGSPVDPHAWMKTDYLKARLTPLPLGPSGFHDSPFDVRMKVEYTGHVPKGMRSGESMRLTAMFIGDDDDG